MRQADSGKIAALLLVVVSMMLSSLAFAQGRPVFVYPVDNQRIGLHAPWKFKVQPMPNVEKYSRNFYQKGAWLSEKITGNTFEISPGASPHKYIKVGEPFEVRVKALIAEKWTEPTIITVWTQDPQPAKAAQPTAVNPQPARPVFDYPKDGQQLDYKGSFDFRVKPIANAKSYTWTISQNGKIVAERNTGNEFYLVPGTAEHSKIVPGRVEVQVLARLAEKWTEPTSITIAAVGQQPVRASQPTASEHPSWEKFGWVLFFLSWPLLIYPLRAKIPVWRKVWNWGRALILAGSLSFVLGILANALFAGQVGGRVTDAMGLLAGPGLACVILKRRFWGGATDNSLRLEEAYKRALGNAGLPDALKPAAERLCKAILSNEGAFQNRRLSPQKIEVVLRGWLYWLLHSGDKQLRIPNLLADGKGAEPAFSVPLYRLLIDVSAAIHGVSNPIVQYLSWTDGTPFSRVVKTLYGNWARVNGFNPDLGETWTKQGEGIQPEHLEDKLTPAGLIDKFLGKTPFVDFFHTKVAVSIPHRSRFEHMHIVGGTGHGKTQLMQYLILHDLPHIAAGGRSVIVIDSKGSLINEILHLASVGAMADRVVLIDPNEYTPALNLFDFGLDRLKGYADERERERILNAAIELYKYLFGALLGAETTPRQTLIFEFLAKLVMVVPGATIDTLLDFLKHPELTRPYIRKLDEDGQQFFETEFFDSEYDGNRQQLATRLWEVKSKAALARMFKAERNKLDLFDAMNRGSLILINTNKRYLSPEGSQIFGRFFIALIGQVIRERELGNQYQLRDTFVYIDEAHEYFNKSMGSLFEQARQFQVGMVIAHQHLGQFKEELRDTVTGNTSVKIAGGVSYDDARDFAKEMWCEPKFLLAMQKYQAEKETEFACYIKNINGLKRAIPLRVPLGSYDNQPKITAARLASLIERNRARYGATNERPPEKPKDDDSPLGKRPGRSAKDPDKLEDPELL